MSYKEFLDNIDKYVGKIVEFTSRFKADGRTFKTERYVWDKNEFGKLKEDALIEILSVRIVRNVNSTVPLPYITRDLTQDERCELWGALIDVVEDWLESKGIVPADIPNKERDSREDAGAAFIYGEDYDNLADQFAAVLGIDRDCNK